MSQRKLLALTAAVLVLFAFIVFFERKMPSTSERREKGDLIWDVSPDGVESLRLEHSGSIIELKKDPGASGSWRMVKPESYPADSGAVNDVTSQIARLRRSGTEMPEARPEDYGLQTPSAKATIFWKGNAKDSKLLSRTLELGIDIPGTDATAAREAGSSRVVFVPSSVATAVRKTADEFKSKEVFGGSTYDVARLEVERGRGRLSLTRKNGVWWLAQPFADLADGDETQRLVGDLTALRALAFLSSAERQNLASLGLAPPLYRVTLADSKSGSTTVDFGATRSDGNSIYARRETQVFTVGSSIAEELSKEAVAFREPRLVHLDRAAATLVSGSFAGTRYAIEKQAAGWSSGGKPVMASGVDDLLSSIADLKSRSFLDETLPAGKERELEATITVRGPVEQWTIQLLPWRAEAHATVSGRPGAFELASDPAPSLRAAFQKAATSLSPTPAPTKAPTPKK